MEYRIAAHVASSLGFRAPSHPAVSRTGKRGLLEDLGFRV